MPDHLRKRKEARTHLMPGDVLLLNGNTKMSTANRTAQKLLAKRVANYSHAALSLGTGSFIHADGNGVNFIFADVLLSEYPGQWLAIRNETISRGVDMGYVHVVPLAARYLYMSYANELRHFIGSEKPEGFTFCSLLVADILKDAGFPIDLDAHKPLPADLEQLVAIEGWMDVTKEYRVALPEILRSEHIKSKAEEAFAQIRALTKHKFFPVYLEASAFFHRQLKDLGILAATDPFFENTDPDL